MFQKIYQNLLMGRSFNIYLAGNLEECETQLQKTTPDLVLVNPINSRGNGIRIMERIRGPKAVKANIPMLVISPKDDMELKSAAMQLGAVDFLIKHLAPPKTVVKRVEAILEHRPPAPKHALDPRALKVGDVLDDRYEILERVGKGGQGAVFRAHDRRLQEEVAMKILILNPELAEELLESFLREVKLSRKVAHRNVVRVHDVGQSGGVHYITMEFVYGTDLNQYIYDNWGLGYGALNDIMIQVTHALRAAHQLGIVHRDVKPQNIMITREGLVKVADFGIASAAGAMLKNTSELSIGTPDYMAPETAQPECNLADPRIDVYSLGVVMYEAYTGVLPFEGKTLMEKIQLHLEGNVRPPSTLNPSFPPALEHVILTAMKRMPGDRFQDMGELLLALKRLQF
ncbi:protein kinase [bacterium]|nr:protein kinase [candidate division CSSED10-310 bacterium]